jgi:hypothetical protein
MVRYIAICAVLAVAVTFVNAQHPAIIGLGQHQQQIQEHLRKEQEHERVHGVYRAPQQQQQQYNQPQYNQYNENNNYARSSNPEADYQEGLRAHMQQIQAHLAKEASHNPQNSLLGENNPAYQQGLQIHQRQLQEHNKIEQQHGGPVPQQQPYYQPPQQQQRSYQQPAPQQYNNYNNGQNSSPVNYDAGLQLHQQQILDHQRQEQQQQAQVGQTSQYHQAQEQQFPSPRRYYEQPQQQSNSYQPQSNFQRGGKVSLANLGF